MQISAEPIGSQYTTKEESDITELSLSPSGLRIIVTTCPLGSLERIWIEYLFINPRGFRFLDEGDLLRYWQSKIFINGYHLFKIQSGGWRDQEIQLSGMLSVTSTIEIFNEWFVCTSNRSLNVISVSPPFIREIK